MSRKYKFRDAHGLYFVSFPVIGWIDIFTREVYCQLFVESLAYCRMYLGMEIYAWCIMLSHVHIIFRAKETDPGNLLKSLKGFTSRKILMAIAENPQESRKEWILSMAEHAGSLNSNIRFRQFWQQHNQPIELWSSHVIQQKVDYIHNNPVEAGFVLEPFFWKYSSAIDFAGGKGILEIDEL